MPPVLTPAWLPPIMSFSSYSGDSLFYVEELYRVFALSLMQSVVSVASKPISIFPEMEEDGKHKSFWHVVTENPHVPHYSALKQQRAERVPWIASILNNHTEPEVLCFECPSSSGRDKNVYFFVPTERYIVILTERGASYFLLTAFYIDHTYKINEYMNKYGRYGAKVW